MTAVEFRACGVYIRTVFRNDEPDDGDLATTRPGLRCRLWGHDRPSLAEHKKLKAFKLDLGANPGGEPNFTTATVGTLECDAPGYTLIGAGTDALGPFDISDDYVNTVYLTERFWSGLPDDRRPPWPPVTAIPQSGRMIPSWPQRYEFQSFIHPNDDADVPRRRHRFLGYYAEVLGQVAGTPNVWNVRVFQCDQAQFVPYKLDFNDPTKFGALTEIMPVANSHGSLFLDSEEASSIGMLLPKLPAGQGAGPVAASQRRTSRGLTLGPPVPNVDTVRSLVSNRDVR